MDAQLEKIREVQKEAWNKSAKGWKKWDDMVMDFMEPMNREMIRMLRLKDDDLVLDIATGTGEPGLSIASIVAKAKVTATDLAEEMLTVAGEKAHTRGIKNFETVCCDVSALPFDDNTYDAISCRLGFIFFPDMQLALQEMVRVLKPGGRIAVSVWDQAEKNSWITTSMQTMISMLQLTPPANGAPGLFRCSASGLMADLFKNAGLRNIEEKQIGGKLKCGTIDTYWNFITEVACPMAYYKAEETLQLQIKEAVLTRVKQINSKENIQLESGSIVICGEVIENSLS